MEINKDESEKKEVNENNQEEEENKKGEENNKEKVEMKREEENKKEEENNKEGDEINKEEEKNNKEEEQIKKDEEGGEIKKEEENNKGEDKIKGDDEKNNKEEGEIKKDEEKNNKEESENKKEGNENNKGEGENKKEEENNKEREEFKKGEENKTAEDEIKKDDVDNNKKEGEIKKDDLDNNKEGGEIKKVVENNNEGGEETKKGEEKNNKEEIVNKKEGGEETKKGEEKNNKEEIENKKEGGEETKKGDEKNNKEGSEIEKEEENKKEGGEETKKGEEKNNKEEIEIKKEGEGETKKGEEKNNKEEIEIKKEGEGETKKGDEKNNKEENDDKKNVENNKDNENNIEEVNKKDDENNKEDEEDEAKKDWFIIKVIGEGIDSEKQSQFENEYSKIDQIIMENTCISEYITKSPKFEKLKSFIVKNSKITKVDLLKKMPELIELSIKSSPNLTIDFLEYLPLKIQKLYLEKNNFINNDFKNIFNFYLSKNDIASNLQCLSFAGNILTRIDLSAPKTKFPNLIELDFRKNKICKIFINSESFPNLKFVNCCKNCLNKSYLNHLKNVISLESVNGYLLEPEFCEPYYKKLKEKLMNKDKVLFRMKYLNISHMPRVQSLEYFISFNMVKNVTKYLKKLDLSYNKLNNKTFFKFMNDNQKFESLRTLNLNANDIDDTFFENKNFQNIFCNLEHLYLNSNKIGDMETGIEYKDDLPIDDIYNDKDKKLIYKLRAIYKFIEDNKHLTKLTITKNPISEFYSVVQEPKNDADKSGKYIKRDINGMIIINCLFSLCIKIRDELLSPNERDTFNLRFDCRSNVNKNSSNYPYNDKPFVYKSKQ